MKAFILIAALALPAPALAATDQHRENCKALAAFAHTIMNTRQQGVALTRVLEAVVAPVEDAEAREIIRTVVMRAYGEPRYTTEQVQESAAADFRDRIHVWCLQ